MNLFCVPIRECTYENDITLEKSYYENTGVIDIPDVHVFFEIQKDNNQDYILKLNANGIFLLEDARSLETIEYPFKIEIKEKLNEESELYERFLKNSQNTLDILSILWENIVLEIPICYTISEELETGEKQSGMSSVEIDPRLAPLMGLLDKEKE